MKRMLVLLCLLSAPAQAQVYEWVGDTLAFDANAITLNTIASDSIYFRAFNDGFVQPGREYKIVRTDSSIMLVEKGCWTKWLDSDSVSHCGHEVRNGPVDSTFEHDRFLTAITKVYWCETDQAEFRIRTEIATKKAE